MKRKKLQNISSTSNKFKAHNLYGHYLTGVWRLVMLLFQLLWFHVFSKLYLTSQSQRSPIVAKARVLSQLQKNYRDFFLEKLILYGINSPSELSKEEKNIFFTEIKRDWAEHKITKSFVDSFLKRARKNNYSTIPRTEGQCPVKRETTTTENADKQIIQSKPNEEQTDNLKIRFNPNNYFVQNENYLYPVINMPKPNSTLKLPRTGRSNKKGYKESAFYDQLKFLIPYIDATDDVHMVIPHFNQPYEPDIVLFDKRLNLYIDIEIDEPYDGYYGYPTHHIDRKGDFKRDNIRDLFFTQSGWIVMRFTEKQVHCQANQCISLVKDMLNSIYNRNFTTNIDCERETQWDYNQCVQWRKIFYREKYLGIDHFKKQCSDKEVKINTEVVERIEHSIRRNKIHNFKSCNHNIDSIEFDEGSHTYIHPKDKTGNALYISVTTAIDRFFPFDLNSYIKKKAIEENRTEEDVLIEHSMIGNEAAEKGTLLHSQIENFFKGAKFDADSTEFDLFLSFYYNEIKKRDLTFFDAEIVLVR